MTVRVQVLLSPEEREELRRRARAAGMSLSAWILRAALERARGETASGWLRSGADLDAFFVRCDGLEPPGREPDWKEHLAEIEASQLQGVEVSE